MINTSDAAEPTAQHTNGPSGRDGDAPSAGWEDSNVRRTIRFGVGPAWSMSQLGLGVAAMAGTALYLFALHQVLGDFAPLWWGLVLIPIMTMSFAGSIVPLLFWGLLVLAWFNQVPAGSFTAWSLVAALGLLVGHAATALSATAPAAASFPLSTWRTWGRRVLIAGGATAVVAGCGSALAGRVTGGSSAAYALGLFGIAVGVMLLRSNEPIPPE